MIDVKSKKGAIVGYMGYQPNADNEGQEGPQGHLDSHIPGYVGYIPGVKSENLYSKTYGKITENCAKGQFNRGIEPPTDAKYTSTTKDTYAHPNKIKGEELGEGTISGVKLSTLSNAGK